MPHLGALTPVLAVRSLDGNLATCHPIHMSIHISIYMPIYMPIHMSIHMPIQMSIQMSIHMSIHMSMSHVAPRSCLWLMSRPWIFGGM